MPMLHRSSPTHLMPRQVVVLSAIHGSRPAWPHPYRPHQPRRHAKVDGRGLATPFHVPRRGLLENLWAFELTYPTLREPGMRLGHRAFEHAGIGEGAPADVLEKRQWHWLGPAASASDSDDYIATYHLVAACKVRTVHHTENVTLVFERTSRYPLHANTRVRDF
jgi:hypothetical protein